MLTVPLIYGEHLQIGEYCRPEHSILIFFRTGKL